MSESQEFPLDLETLLPQKPPMRVLDTLEAVGEGTAELLATVPADSPFVAADGRLDRAAFLEMIAQGIAARNAFDSLGSDAPPHLGLLLGARNLEILESARVGDVLRVHVERYAKLGEFGVVKGAITRGDELLARGLVTVWGKEEGEDAAHGTDAADASNGESQ